MTTGVYGQRDDIDIVLGSGLWHDVKVAARKLPAARFWRKRIGFVLYCGYDNAWLTRESRNTEP